MSGKANGSAKVPAAQKIKLKVAKEKDAQTDGASKAVKSQKAATAKKRKAADTDGLGEPQAKKAPTKTAGALSTTSAGQGTAEKAPKKVKAKADTKPKGPVDVEKQCGVPLPQGGLCARSLTCKSHSMGAKRAVQGRSQPYDILLAQYQKKNHAKLSLKAASDQAHGQYDDTGPPVDSDEEVSTIVDAVFRSTARSAQTKALVPVRRRRRFLLAREMMATALKNNAGSPAIQIHGKYIPFQA